MVRICLLECRTSISLDLFRALEQLININDIIRDGLFLVVVISSVCLSSSFPFSVCFALDLQREDPGRGSSGVFAAAFAA